MDEILLGLCLQFALVVFKNVYDSSPEYLICFLAARGRVNLTEQLATATGRYHNPFYYCVSVCDWTSYCRARSYTNIARTT